MPVASEIYDALRAFADAVTAKFAGAAAGEPEEQLRAPFEDLLQAAGAAMGRNIVCVGEVRLGHRLGKPDYGIEEGGLLTGYAELKAPGKGVVRRRFAGHDLEQFDRFTQLPNVLYSDGNEWALYRYGQRERPPVRLAGDVAARPPRRPSNRNHSPPRAPRLAPHQPGGGGEEAGGGAAGIIASITPTSSLGQRSPAIPARAAFRTCKQILAVCLSGVNPSAICWCTWM